MENGFANDLRLQWRQPREQQREVHRGFADHEQLGGVPLIDVFYALGAYVGAVAGQEVV
jgi:hypothetical protein